MQCKYLRKGEAQHSGEMVRTRSAIETTRIRSLAARLVRKEDLPRFLKMTLDELRNLHDGNIARYRLRLAEFRAWRGMLQ